MTPKQKDIKETYWAMTEARKDELIEEWIHDPMSSDEVCEVICDTIKDDPAVQNTVLRLLTFTDRRENLAYRATMEAIVSTAHRFAQAIRDKVELRHGDDILEDEYRRLRGL